MTLDWGGDDLFVKREPDPFEVLTNEQEVLDAFAEHFPGSTIRDMTPEEEEQFRIRWDADAGESAKREGMAQAASARDAQEWRELATRWLDRKEPGSIFTADDLVAAIGLPTNTEGRDQNNAVGAWVGSMSRAGRIEWTNEWRKSDRVRQHRADQRVWRVVVPGQQAIV